jgi:ABC-type nickel/cobalt efflux system permease component RcnA
LILREPFSIDRRTILMTKLLVAALAAIAVVFMAPATASAHPLGNFTVNRYAGIEIAGSEIYVRYALDLAEIPTYQLEGDLRTPGYANRLARKLELNLDGRLVPLRVVEQRVTSRPGAGGLKTLRFEVVYRALGEGVELRFADTAFPGRIGWREVTVAARDGARILESSAPGESESNVLRAYPGDLLRSPLDVSTAIATIEPGGAAGPPPVISSSAAAEHTGGGFEALIEQRELSLSVLLLSFLIAAFWGAAHALTPGHGKALVAAYLVGTRGTPRHAFMLGGTVTIAHTAGVFALGLVTLALSQFILSEQLYPWLTLASGVLVVVVGASVLRQRLRFRGTGHGHDHHHHDGGHDHDHHHDHDDPAQLTSKGILGAGIAAGLLPCPSALVVLLSAIALHRVGLGLALIVAFSIGLAVTITTIGLVAVLAQRAFGRLSLNGPVVRALPSFSAALILVVGVVITARAIPGVI